MSRPGSLLISLKNVAVAYPRRVGFFRVERYWALKNISFDLYGGETLGVIGRNGVGKSTLLRIMAGIIEPDKGEVIINNVTVSLLSLQAGFIGHLTGRENAVLSGMMLGLEKKEILSRISEIQDYSGIGDFFDQPVHVYSTGMKSRLGFSIAINIAPDVILLDEVLGVGDVDFKAKSAKLLQERMRSNETFVLVSHNVNRLRELCDRVVWIEDGVVIMQGGANEVLDAYLAEGKRRSGGQSFGGVSERV
ncbi:ABC transporter ATP-binding protein [Candidatus Parcubacteria bacterium]|nr:MAG: ABC transporter ATP-binding protein [Candidatus Parcubacteria bacterium]